MEHLGININIKNIPELDPGFIPLFRFNQEFLRDAKKPIGIAVERNDGEISSHSTFIHGTEEYRDADRYYIERFVKTILWMKGGFRIYVCGDEGIYEYMKACYSDKGLRDFDVHFFEQVYERPFEVVYTDTLPETKDCPKSIGGHFDGCRIGLDIGGSDRKVSAVVNGEVVYDEETVWLPKQNADPDYHYNGFVDSLKSAAAHMPRVDAVGVSTAGVIIADRAMIASLFVKVPQDQFDKKVKNIFIRAIKDTFGDIPYSVINDGDVTALAGAMSLGDSNILGIAMGTSEAGGFVDNSGNIKGWINELAFVPVDANPEAAQDDWSLDIGVGSRYFSQEAVIKLAPNAGITFEDGLTPAEKLKYVQGLMDNGDERACAVFKSIGAYLAHSLIFYHSLYGFRHVLLLGRVMSGKGGDLLLDTCKSVLADEYSELSKQFSIDLPDEKFRRLGQSATAASLAEV